jgi:hypothetical protein
MVSFESDEKTYNSIKFRKPIKVQVSTKPIVRKGDIPDKYYLKDMQLKK